ncbi:amino acid ABC transporter substrate-binding protein [Polynucleobacter sp. IMCC 29146]|uniref:amino acid ABC transporter substrate-binding protein n=1 Tax=Polynucleobacter sp. IMCC 29146 TaxID=2780953 RepID=UPI001F3B4492|nr:amino acid ABC transporter substrate-binding protein [Polynucleobacter sp. IMCC 29146]
MTLFISINVQAQLNNTDVKIKKLNIVNVGVRESSAPLSYMVGSNAYSGYHVELCERILKKLYPNAKINYMAVTPQNRIPLIQNGTIDIECGSTSNTTARKEQVDFAVTTYVTEARYAVKKSSGINSTDDVIKKKIVTTVGTTPVQHLRKLELLKGVKLDVTYAKDHSEAFLLVESDRADAFAMDDNILAGNIAASKSPGDYKIVGDPLSVEAIAIMLRKDDPVFKAGVDNQIKDMMKSGELKNVYQKWFLAPIPPKGSVIGIPMGNSLVELFKNPSDIPAEPLFK